ncbi:hypothetical protein [Pelagibacterium halotolerans]|uniref:Uncharacterized protein n=1 Tax=Pelagibacterium halotolerans (strain DSM 22347 / JCM 15775 / CGMCC 1.7692 / B2) TaxID=1082931 RepID=G4RGD5_PELHB|nr:hypothetical protein [Pelagibacterium halotolerans]AEQ50111.1 hypothetical protein KKY_63 [Pelagibacterium halotolerans B2]QJR19874.1 hypothetical protein HKM20_16400 [Pelagibacterium halotolerans]SEA48202.1 hypothetical protein SAMN05428936_104148 [Pelagibacterium halotolerans]
MNKLSRLSLATILMATTSQAALALEATDFADRLVETSKLMGVSFAYGSATAEGDTVTITDFVISTPGQDDIEVPGDVVFTGVVETAEGGFSAERASIADFEYTDEDEGFSVSFVDIAAEGILLPADAGIDSVIEIGFNLYDRISAGPLTVSDETGTELFAVDLMEITMEEPTADGGLSSAYQVTGIRGDLSAIEEAEAQEVFEAFGLTQLNASMSGSGTWWPETGEGEVTDISLAVQDLGSLSLDFAVAGYTEEIYRELMKVNLKMAEMAEADIEIDEDQMAEMSEAMLEKMADLKLVGGALRYDDDSLFMKVLDFIGAEQGVDGETFKAGLQFMVPMALAEVENEAFKTMVTSAVNTFIADPQNFTISVEPEEPIAFSEFEGMETEVEADPFVLVDLLNVQITANQ